jgi:hypothetical protein
MNRSFKSFAIVTSIAFALGVCSPHIQAQILGLDNTVIHLEGPSQTNDPFTAAYNDYPLYTAPLNDAGLSQVATFVSGTTDGSNTFGSSADTTTEVTYLRYTFLDKADVFTFTGATNDTTTFLGADAAGVGANGADTQTGNVAGTDTSSASSGFIDNASGYLDVTTPGSFTFTLTEADDQARVQVDGSTVVETNFLDGTQSATTTLTAGYHTFDLLYYQNGGGQNLEYSVTPGEATGGDGFSVFQYTATEGAVPEPTSLSLFAAGLLGLVVYRLRLRRG